jgi:hypothetical protein
MKRALLARRFDATLVMFEFAICITLELLSPSLSRRRGGLGFRFEDLIPLVIRSDPSFYHLGCAFRQRVDETAYKGRTGTEWLTATLLSEGIGENLGTDQDYQPIWSGWGRQCWGTRPSLPR